MRAAAVTRQPGGRFDQCFISFILLTLVLPSDRKNPKFTSQFEPLGRFGGLVCSAERNNHELFWIHAIGLRARRHRDVRRRNNFIRR